MFATVAATASCHWNCFTKFSLSPYLFSCCQPSTSILANTLKGSCFFFHLADVALSVRRSQLTLRNSFKMTSCLCAFYTRRLLSTSKFSLCQVCVTESVLRNTFHPFMEEIRCFHWCVVLMGCRERQVPPKWHHYVCSKLVGVQQKDWRFFRKKERVRAVHRARWIIGPSEDVLSDKFSITPSGCQAASLWKTNYYSNLRLRSAAVKCWQ